MFLLKNFSVIDPINVLKLNSPLHVSEIGFNKNLTALIKPLFKTFRKIIRQLHFNTENAYARGLARGAFSIHQKFSI